MMSVEMVANVNCRHIVVVRWDKSDTTSTVPSANATLQFLKNVGYKTDITDRIRCMPCPSEHDQFIMLPLISVDEAIRICNDSDTKGFAINKTRIVINRLIGPNGVRVRDVTDCIRLWHDNFSSGDMLNVLLGLVGMEIPERGHAATVSYHLFQAAMGELVENARCTVFGSFASTVRRNGYSDIDINVESVVTAERPGSDSVRPLQQVLSDPKCLIGHPLTRAEFHSYPHQDLIKILYRCFSDHPTFKDNFVMSFVPARTPILTFKLSESGMNMFFDISVNNQAGVDKANLLDQFILQDKSPEENMKKAVAFLLFWAKSNKLMNGSYPEEKTEIKTGFNSYIMFHLIIHFVQAVANKDIVFPKAARPEGRVIEYNFNELFADHTMFLSKFFKYYANFDFANNAIYGKHAVTKTIIENVHKTPRSPLMIMDPMDCTHNISAKSSEDAIKLLNGLIRSALFIIKRNDFRIGMLLRTHLTAKALMEKKDSTCTTTNQVPAALAEFAAMCGTRQDYLTFQLPSMVQTSEEFMILLTRILRFDVSPSHEGPSVNNLYNTMGVIFVILARSWIGRRNKKRHLKAHLRREPTGVELEVICSDSYKTEVEPIAELRVAMSDLPESQRKVVYVEMKHGQVADVRDAMHFLIDQFMANNSTEICQNGVMSIANFPKYTG